MNHEELERQLRSQHGPREQKYAPSRLPANLDVGPSRRPGPSPVLRAGMLVGVAVAAALSVAVISSILSGPNPDIGGTTSATPSATVSAPVSPGDGTCDRSDVTFTAESWGGAAGSRGTMVTIALAPGRSACSLPPSVSVQIEDAQGTVLVGSGSLVAGGPVVLEPGASYIGGAEWSNWCGSDPTVPVTLAVKLGSWPAWVPVNVPVGGVSPVPPCSGEGPTTLGLTEFRLWP